MQEIECSVSILKIKEYTRLQCMHGCVHYKRNPLCPPLCPDIHWFKNFIESYQKVKVFFDIIKFTNEFDLTTKRNSFHTKLLGIEQRLKREGKYYALCFVSGACTMCEKEKCKSKECKRVTVGRTPVCATGIDLMHLSTAILELSKEDALSFWKPNLSKEYFDKLDNNYLCLGLIFY